LNSDVTHSPLAECHFGNNGTLREVLDHRFVIRDFISREFHHECFAVEDLQNPEVYLEAYMYQFAFLSRQVRKYRMRNLERRTHSQGYIAWYTSRYRQCVIVKPSSLPEMQHRANLTQDKPIWYQSKALYDVHFPSLEAHKIV
jgi:hypothetical protein